MARERKRDNLGRALDGPITEEEQAALDLELFKQFDIDHSDTLTYDEVKLAFKKKLGKTEEGSLHPLNGAPQMKKILNLPRP